MEWYTFLGMFFTAAMTIVGVSLTVSKHFKEQSEKTFEQREKQIDALNKQTQETIKLNLNMQHMNENLLNTGNRVTKHGKEIDKCKDLIQDHETRIRVLESK
jgi:peptidoglycan hydrolase CwlO-like protein